MHDPLRIAELMKEWQMSMPKLLELAVTHELGHAFCEEKNEAAADHFGEELRKGQRPPCQVSKKQRMGHRDGVGFSSRHFPASSLCTSLVTWASGSSTIDW
jgi:hypothetical protein